MTREGQQPQPEELRKAALTAVEDGLKEIDRIIAGFQTYQDKIIEKIENFAQATPHMMEQLRRILRDTTQEFSKLDEVAGHAQVAALELLGRIEAAERGRTHAYDSESRVKEIQEKLQELVENLRTAISIVKRNLISDLRSHRSPQN